MSQNEGTIQPGWQVPFFTIWTGQAFSLLGSQLVQFALIWWLTKTTGSATVLATASIVGMLPQVLFGPFAGALVDRWNRRMTMILADSLVALSTVGLVLLFWSGAVQIWHVYFVMLVRSAGASFHWPAVQASTSLMVPKEHLARIQGFNQMLHGAMNIGAAPLGALLLGLLPMQGVLAVDIGTAILAVLPLLFVAVPQPKRAHSTAPQDSKTTVLQDLGEGFRYLRSWPGLVLVVLMATLINLLLNPASALLPILITNHFGGGAGHLAWMESAWGLGVVVGGLTLGAWGGFRRRILTSLCGLVILGVFNSSVGLVPAAGFWIAVALIFVVGFTNPMINGPLFAVMQSAVAPEMQGRVFTLVSSVAMGATPLGLAVAGPVADLVGVRFCYLVGGILTALLGIGAFFIPAILHLEDGRDSAGGEGLPAQNLGHTPGD